jgi:tRNA threonylcarbamoyladenosine biosynthesis protein TsaE
MAGAASPQETALTITTGSAEETQALGRRCGQLISAPMSIFLLGELGSGKTMFAQGLAAGLDVPAEYYVTSPSYTLVNEYPGRLPLYHIDLYRLEAGLDPEELGLDELLHGAGVAAVEWADRLPADASADRLEVRFEIGADDRRTLRLRAYGQAAASLLKVLVCFNIGGSPWD